MNYSRIVGTGGYLPAKQMSNDEISQLVETSDAWIVERTGIHSRHIADEHETASSMAKIATERALEAAGMQASQLDMIIVATCTPDRIFPSTACLLQQALGIDRIPAFDVSAACAGFSYALSVADQYIRQGIAKNILIVGSEVMSRVIDWKDRSTCILFGDGAGAVILQADKHPGIHSTHLHASGAYQDILFLPNDKAAPALKSQSCYMQMKGQDVFKVAVREFENVIDETLKANHMVQSDIDWLIPHQANIRIIQATAKKLSLPMENVILTLSTQGNTSSASIPLALNEGIRSGKIKRGQKLLLLGIGGGMVWGSALVTY